MSLVFLVKLEKSCGLLPKKNLSVQSIVKIPNFVRNEMEKPKPVKLAFSDSSLFFFSIRFNNKVTPQNTCNGYVFLSQ